MTDAMTQPKPLYAAIEGGGTKFNCAVGHGPDDVLRQVRLATRGPDETLAEVAAFLSAARAELGPISGLGTACFGPLRLDPSAPDYGRLLAESKRGWDGADLVGPLAAAAGCPAALETDVNAAALAEAQLGAGRSADPVVYVTVGTGIGVGVVVGGNPVHGLLHPEGGHMRLRRHPADAGFAGVCAYHGDCAEGVASGPAIAARSGIKAEVMAADHPDWEIVAATLGELCATLVFTLAPQRIVLGGGVMTSGRLLPRVRELTGEALAGFIAPLTTAEGLAGLIVPPQLAVPGLAGAFLLAYEAVA
jgi:fructokinase